jgi:sigma-B regulation protein RsbU (phosphoserine phosphatase)
MLYGILTPASGEFRYVNAGQMPPIVVGQSGAIVSHQQADVPAGIMTGGDYTVRRIQLQPGDTLVLYTDGLTDALARGGSGVEELEKFLAPLAGRDLSGWRDELERAIALPRHVDDVTLVAIRLTSEPLISI